jgi:hypothetical protein
MHVRDELEATRADAVLDARTGDLALGVVLLLRGA